MPDNNRRQENVNDRIPMREASVMAFIENQKLDLQYRMAELEQRKSEDNHNYEYALKALDAQKEDRSEVRLQYFAHKKIVYLYSTIVLILGLVFISWALCAGYSDFLATIVEKALFFGAGGASMYGYGRYKNNKDEENE